MSTPRTCRHSGKKFAISTTEMALLTQMKLPLSDLCPEERLRLAMSARNEWKLYRRKCDATGSEILSAYPSESPFVIYRSDVWWGDSWDALSYGRPVNTDAPFFPQFLELQKAVPREGTSVFRSENCDYNGHIRDSKNCYMNALASKCEDVHYSYWIENGKNVVDCMYTNFSTLCYECRDCSLCYNATSLEECSNCNDCHFSYQLIGCTQCLFCTNLANKTLHLFNKPCSKEEFEEAKSAILNGSFHAWQEASNTYAKQRANAVHRAVHNLNCQEVTGDHFYNARECDFCFDGHDCEDCMDTISLSDSKNVGSSYSVGWPGCELVYLSSVVRDSQEIAFCRYVWFSNDLRYCDSCASCKHCFGCIGLRHKQHCILNKQYTKEEYERLLPLVIATMEKSGEWGQFFPSTSAPFAYNETAAQDYFPLERANAISMGFRWRDAVDESPAVKKTIPAGKLPDNLDETPDDVLQWAIQCEATKRPFRIVKQELDFYRSMRLPLPRLHPKERHRLRLAQRNPYILWSRLCGKCGKPTSTTYAPERPETIYCEGCYLKEVY